MKKLLIATAALAMVAGTAQAQSSVSVYGIIDVNINSMETEGTASDSTGTTRGENTLSTSRLGFKGTEDLGGGTKAEFQLEAKMTPQDGVVGAGGTTNAGQIFNRESWVGLTDAKLGSIRIGFTDVSDAVNIDATVSQAGELALASELGTDKARVIRYTTPTFNGFSAQYGNAQPGATATAENTALNITSAVVKYEAGKLGVYAGMESRKVTTSFDQKQTMYGVKYDFGPVALGAFYSVQDGAAGTVGTGGATPAAPTGEDTARELKQTRLTAAAPVAALGKGVSVHAAYLKNESATVVNTDYTETKLALTKAFSKRTTGYVAYSMKDLELDGSDTNTATVGIRHVF
jgi:predicted porin